MLCLLHISFTYKQQMHLTSGLEKRVKLSVWQENSLQKLFLADIHRSTAMS